MGQLLKKRQKSLLPVPQHGFYDQVEKWVTDIFKEREVALTFCFQKMALNSKKL